MSSKPYFFFRRADWTSCSLGLDSIPFLLKDRIENPDLFCQLTRIQHRFFPKSGLQTSIFLMLIDTTTTTTTLQLLYLRRADWNSSSLVIWHAGSTAFPFYPKRGLKIQALLTADAYIVCCFFIFNFLKSELKIQLLFCHSTLTVFSFVRRAD